MCNHQNYPPETTNHHTMKLLDRIWAACNVLIHGIHPSQVPKPWLPSEPYRPQPGDINVSSLDDDKPEVNWDYTKSKIPSSFDAMDWANEFVELVNTNPAIATDRDCMLGWFANSIMAGFDEAYRRAARDARLQSDRPTEELRGTPDLPTPTTIIPTIPITALLDITRDLRVSFDSALRVITEVTTSHINANSIQTSRILDYFIKRDLPQVMIDPKLQSESEVDAWIRQTAAQYEEDLASTESTEKYRRQNPSQSEPHSEGVEFDPTMPGYPTE